MTAISPEAVEEYRKRLEQAFNGTLEDDRNFDAYQKTALEFYSHFPSFSRWRVVDYKTDQVIRSPSLKRTICYLDAPDDDLAQKMIDQGRAASRIFAEELSLEERLEFLHIFKDKVDVYKTAIALAINIDSSKPIDGAMQEMEKGDEWFDYTFQFAPTVLAPHEVILETAKGPIAQTTYQNPKGVVQTLSAYNYPAALGLAAIVPSLASGNAPIVFGAAKSPSWIFPFMSAASDAMDEFLHRASNQNKPWTQELAKNRDGLIQIATGVHIPAPNSNVAPLTQQADFTHFVGGPIVGKIIAQQRLMKPSVFELGGLNVAVVMDSALDVEGVEPEVKEQEISGILYENVVPLAGQRCTAPRLMIYEAGARGVVDRLGDLFVNAKLDTGNPHSRGVKSGPVVDGNANKAIEKAMEVADEVGATVYCYHNDRSLKDTSRVMIDWSKVDYSKPGVREKVDAILHNEIFGPILHIAQKISGIKEAINFTRKYDTEGLVGTIFAVPEDAQLYVDHVEVANVSIKGPTKDASPQGPHGNWDQAKVGGENGIGLLLYCNPHVSRELAPKPKMSGAVPS